MPAGDLFCDALMICLSFILPGFGPFIDTTNGPAESGQLLTFFSTLGNEGGKLVGALAPALVEAHLFVRLAVRHRPVQHTRGVSRLAAQVLKRDDHRHERLFRPSPPL